jgi:uncharacterized membrane protein YgcG
MALLKVTSRATIAFDFPIDAAPGARVKYINVKPGANSFSTDELGITDKFIARMRRNYVQQIQDPDDPTGKRYIDTGLFTVELVDDGKAANKSSDGGSGGGSGGGSNTDSDDGKGGSGGDGKSGKGAGGGKG